MLTATQQLHHLSSCYAASIAGTTKKNTTCRSTTLPTPFPQRTALRRSPQGVTIDRATPRYVSQPPGPPLWTFACQDYRKDELVVRIPENFSCALAQRRQESGVRCWLDDFCVFLFSQLADVVTSSQVRVCVCVYFFHTLESQCC